MAEVYQPTSLDSVALSLIDVYKQKLSGGFVFRDMHCSFEGDTCSVYGKRIIEAIGIGRGFSLIRERMHRCRDFKLFAFDEHTLGWERGFQRIIDNPSEENIGTLLEGLHLVDESLASIGHVLKGSQTVHRYVYDESSDIIAKFIEREGVQDVKAKVRNAQGYKTYLQIKLAERGIPVVGAELLSFMDGVPDELVHIGVALYVLNAVRIYMKRVNFFEQFERMGEIRNQ